MPTRAYRRAPEPVDPATERARRLALRDRLDRGLAKLAARASDPPADALAVQLLAHVVRHDAYANFRASRDAAWKETGFSTRTWPRRIRATDYLVLLLPLSAPPVGPGVGDHPEVVVADPVFFVDTPVRADDYRELVLEVVTSWLFHPAAETTALLGAPMIEAIGRRGVVERHPETFGRSWPPAVQHVRAGPPRAASGACLDHGEKTAGAGAANGARTSRPSAGQAARQATAPKTCASVRGSPAPEREHRTTRPGGPNVI